MPTTSPRWGYVYATLAAMLWAVSGSAAKFLFNSGVTASQLVQIRMTITVVGLLVWLAIRHPGRLRIRRQDIMYFAVFGAIGMASMQFTWRPGFRKMYFV